MNPLLGGLAENPGWGSILSPTLACLLNKVNMGFRLNNFYLQITKSSYFHLVNTIFGEENYYKRIDYPPQTLFL